MFVTSVRATVILLTGWLIFDVHYGHAGTSWWLVLAVFGVTLVAMYNLGMMFASLFLMWGREAWHISNLLMEPIYLLSGVNFPVRSLGIAAALAGAIIPMTLGMDALRQLLFADAPGLIGVGWELLILLVLAALFLLLAVWLLKALERMARREGRLTMRWQ
jgi:ABC-2 type transport system permease protein